MVGDLGELFCYLEAQAGRAVVRICACPFRGGGRDLMNAPGMERTSPAISVGSILPRYGISLLLGGAHRRRAKWQRVIPEKAEVSWSGDSSLLPRGSLRTLDPVPSLLVETGGITGHAG